MVGNRFEVVVEMLWMVEELSGFPKLTVLILCNMLAALSGIDKYPSNWS